MAASLLYVFALCIGVTSLTAAVFFAVEIARLRTEATRLRRELEKRTEKLKVSEVRRETLLTSAVLDMPGHVAAIEGYAARLLRGEAGKLPTKAQTAAEKIASAAKRLSELLAAAQATH